MALVAVVMVADVFQLGFLSPLPALFNDLDVVVENGGYDGDHVGLDDPGPDGLGAADANVDDTLEGKIPLPHAHHIFTPPLLEDADETLDASIDGEDVADSGGGGGEVGEMVEGVYERQGRCAVEGAAVVESGGDAHGRLVDVRDAEVDFPHDGVMDLASGEGGIGPVSLEDEAPQAPARGDEGDGAGRAEMRRRAWLCQSTA